MADSTAKASGLRPSFASVAARPLPRNGPTIVGQEQASAQPQPPQLIPKSVKPATSGRSSALQSQRELQPSMARLQVNGSPPATNTLDEQARSNIKRAGLRVDDSQSQAPSASTTAASLDGKSTTSGTTFAFDEKESLRPDDSASVQAVDDDETGSGPASGAANSRIGSEAGIRAFRDQFNEVSDHTPANPHRPHQLGRRVIADIQEEGPQMLAQAPSVAVPQQVLPDPGIPVVPGFSMPYEYRGPDEKLFEALGSQKDRMFLLRLEQDIINFIKNTSESHINLPPCNSFCRLLAHKLADYYALTHFVDNAQSAVTLYRTPYCRTPTPLGVLARSHGQEENVPPPVSQPAKQIMRRPGLSKDGRGPNSGPGTTESSVVPSKAGSENEDDGQQNTGATSPNESTLAKDKQALSRAEREARYKEKREEIFGPEGENVDSNEAVNEISRASSTVDDKKKKKKPKPNNDDFEARSQFNAYYPTMQYAVNPYDPAANASTYFVPLQMPRNQAGISQPNFYGSGMQIRFQPSFPSVTPTPSFANMVPQSSMTNGFQGQAIFPAYDHQGQPQFFAMMQPQMVPSPPLPTMASPRMDGSSQFARRQPYMQATDAQIPQDSFNYPFQQHIQQQPQAPCPPVPYQFGQLPVQSGMQNGGKLAHPLPGSYTRPQAFNPQTRSFVPTGPATHQPITPQSGNASPMNKKGPVKAFANGNQAALGSGPPQMQSLAPSASPNPKSSYSRKTASQAGQAQSPPASSLSKWGTPANLPPKPPPPDAPSMPDSLPTNNQFSASVQPMSAGQPMPQFQNGVYSIPSAGPQ